MSKSNFLQSIFNAGVSRSMSRQYIFVFVCTVFEDEKIKLGQIVCKQDYKSNEVVNKDKISAGTYRVTQNTVKLRPRLKRVKSKVRCLEIETTGNIQVYEKIKRQNCSEQSTNFSILATEHFNIFFICSCNIFNVVIMVIHDQQRMFFTLNCMLGFFLVELK